VIVRFADFGGIVDHHCLNYLFIQYILSRMLILNLTVNLKLELIGNDKNWNCCVMKCKT
jgi:hypothetical protein